MGSDTVENSCNGKGALYFMIDNSFFTYFDKILILDNLDCINDVRGFLV